MTKQRSPSRPVDRARRDYLELVYGENVYGIVAHGSCSDEVHFDGWYSVKSLADWVYEDFRKRYPNALVHLVTRVRSDWRKER
jgi:hypothetical protein